MLTNENIENPNSNDVFRIGTLARILRILKMPDGNITVILQGTKRFEIENFIQEEPYLKAVVKEFPEKIPTKKDKEFVAIIENIREIATKIIEENPNIPSDATFAIKNIESNSFLVNFVSSNLNLNGVKKQELLVINDLKLRALETLKFMNDDLQKSNKI